MNRPGDSGYTATIGSILILIGVVLIPLAWGETFVSLIKELKHASCTRETLSQGNEITEL